MSRSIIELALKVLKRGTSLTYQDELIEREQAIKGLEDMLKREWVGLTDEDIDATWRSVAYQGRDCLANKQGHEPSRTQTKQIVDGLQRCHHPDSQHEFLRAWIRDWTIHKTAPREWVGLNHLEPVAWANSFDLQNFDMKVRTCPDLHHTVPLYTAPPKQWVGLTDEEKEKLVEAFYGTDIQRLEAIEAKLKAKNGG